MADVRISFYINGDEPLKKWGDTTLPAGTTTYSYVTNSTDENVTLPLNANNVDTDLGFVIASGTSMTITVERGGQDVVLTGIPYHGNRPTER